MDDWQPIETAPRDTPILVYGYSIQGQCAPGGPYEYHWVTVGQIDWNGECSDLLEPGCDCVRGRTMETPTHWMLMPAMPVNAQTTKSEVK